jgi:hypothetical protein
MICLAERVKSKILLAQVVCTLDVPLAVALLIAGIEQCQSPDACMQATNVVGGMGRADALEAGGHGVPIS